MSVNAPYLAFPKRNALNVAQKSKNFGQNKALKVPDKKLEQKKYSDPLMKFPIRGLAYSNELGAALSEISPKIGTMLWVPALMYFGADIYDKYKNDNDKFSPNGERGLKQAIFQACASVVLPTAAV